ncbi:MAG: hypothetical protein AAGD32_10190 [Planctomycetota bacterium]
MPIAENNVPLICQFQAWSHPDHVWFAVRPLDEPEATIYVVALMDEDAPAFVECFLFDAVHENILAVAEGRLDERTVSEFGLR